MHLTACLTLVLCSLPALAQMPAKPEPLTSTVRESYQTMRMYLIASAEMMAEEHYDFKLTSVSRPFGEWVRHTAEMNYGSCATIRGVAKPDPKSVEAAKRRTDLIDVLKQSFEFCDPAFRGLTDRQMLTETVLDGRSRYPVAEVVGLTNSLHEHYGNLIGYLRSKGVTPPSTLRTQRVLQ
jgi:hypothetical protein